MKKEKFLELASQLFDQTNQEVETKIPVDEDTFEEIVDQLASELFESGIDLVEDYELGMCGREIELDSINFNLRRIERSIKEVLERYLVVEN